MAQDPLQPAVAETECFICRSTEGDDIIAPCACRGSLRWIHRKCLDEWRAQTRDPRYITNCRQCNFQYVVRRGPDLVETQWRRRQRFLGQAVKHFTLSAAAVQGVLCLVAMLIRALDQKEVLVTYFNFTQVEDSPPAGEGTFWEAMRYHKSTYYLAAVLCVLLLGGLVVTARFLFRVCRLDPQARREEWRRWCSDMQAEYCTACRGRSCDYLGPDCSFFLAFDVQLCCAWFFGAVAGVTLTFVFIGLFFAMMMLVVLVQKKVQNYLQLRVFRGLVADYIVQDLSGPAVAQDEEAARELRRAAQAAHGRMDEEELAERVRETARRQAEARQAARGRIDEGELAERVREMARQRAEAQARRLAMQP